MAAARHRDDRGGGGGRMGWVRGGWGRAGRQEAGGGGGGGRRSVRPGFSHEKALIFGVIQVLAGIAALVLGVVAISTKAWGYYYAAGLWSGAVFISAGVFGLAAARRKSNCTIITFMILSAIAAILALVTMTLSAIGVGSDNMLFQTHHATTQGSALVVHSLIIVVSVIAAVCGTASSIVGCRAVCGVWYLPENPYHSPDLQTPTSAEFTGFRQNSNLQYLVDPDLRGQTQHLMGNNLGVNEAGDSRGSTSICPPAAYEYPNTVTSGPQQIAILAPASDGSVYGMMHASDQSGGISQVMYIMPNNGSCPQPGPAARESVPEPPGTPPPSYSQINLTQVGLDESDHSSSQQARLDEQRGPHVASGGSGGGSSGGGGGSGGGGMSHSGSHNSDTASVSTFSTGPLQCSTPNPNHDMGEAPFPTQLPSLDRLLPLNIARPVPLRPHRSGQHRPSSMSSRTSGTQTTLVPATTAPSSASTTAPAPASSSTSTSSSVAQRATRPPSQRHSGILEASARESQSHRRSAPPEVPRHHQSVGTQVGPQTRCSSSSSSSRGAGRHHTRAACGGSGGQHVRSSRSSREHERADSRVRDCRHKEQHQHQHHQQQQPLLPPQQHQPQPQLQQQHHHHPPSQPQQQQLVQVNISDQPVELREHARSSHSHRSHWRHSGSYNSPPPAATSSLEPVVTSAAVTELTSPLNDLSGHRCWGSSQHSLAQDGQPVSPSALASVL